MKILKHSIRIREAAALSLHVRRVDKRGFLCSGRGNHGGDVRWLWFFQLCGDTDGVGGEEDGRWYKKENRGVMKVHGSNGSSLSSL